MAGIKDIAKITGLSLATVSRVFNNSPLVSAKTKEKVLKAAAEIEYQPNMMAVALRSGKSKIIGVIVPEVNNHFFSSIINGIEQKVSDFGYHLIIAQSHESFENECDAIQSFIQLNVDGVLLSLSKGTSDFSSLQQLIKNEIPIVFFDRMPDLKPINSVVLNDYHGAYIATQHLIDCGCKQLLHIAGDQKVSIFNERKKGFIDALKENDLQTIGANCVSLNWNIIEDTASLKNLLSQHPTIDGIFAHGDESCLYTMNILKNLHKNIPEQIKMIGFGNTGFSALVNPSISTIDQKCDEMGEMAADILLKNLNRDTPIFSKQILTPKLIIRDSTKPTR